MLLSLSGAHAPFFARNLPMLTDSAGQDGIAEVPGGEPIRRPSHPKKPCLVR